MNTEIATIQEASIGLSTASGFALAQRVATALSSSNMVPQAFRGNVPDCLVALELATRMDASPLMVLQNLNVIHGRPSFSAKFLIATWNSSGKYSPITYEFSGEGGDYGCRALSSHIDTGRVIEGPKVTWSIVQSEGWASKAGSKWKGGMRELMFRYRAAAWLINTTDPGLSMGMLTAEEAHDIQPAPAGVTVLSADPAPAPAHAPDELPTDAPKLIGGDVNGKWCGQVMDQDTDEIYWSDTTGSRYSAGIHAWNEANNMPAYDRDGVFTAATNEESSE